MRAQGEGGAGLLQRRMRRRSPRRPTRPRAAPASVFLGRRAEHMCLDDEPAIALLLNHVDVAPPSRTPSGESRELIGPEGCDYLRSDEAGGIHLHFHLRLWILREGA